MFKPTPVGQFGESIPPVEPNIGYIFFFVNIFYHLAIFYRIDVLYAHDEI